MKRWIREYYLCTYAKYSFEKTYKNISIFYMILSILEKLISWNQDVYSFQGQRLRWEKSKVRFLDGKHLLSPAHPIPQEHTIIVAHLIPHRAYIHAAFLHLSHRVVGWSRIRTDHRQIACPCVIPSRLRRTVR